MMQQTSILAYREIRGELAQRQADVYEIIKVHQPITNYRISKLLGKAINSVTPRVKELRDKKLVMAFNTTIEETGRKSIQWVTSR